MISYTMKKNGIKKYKMNRKKFEQLFYNRHKEVGIDNGPSQHPFELWALLSFLESYYPKIDAIAEIGVFKGGTLRFWREILSDDGILIGIDLNDRGFIPQVQKEFELDKRIEFVIGNSISNDVVNKVKEKLNGRLLDMLYIDGNHNQAWGDYISYKDFIKSKGLIVFHDIHDFRSSPKTVEDWKKIISPSDFSGYCEFVGGGPDLWGTGIIVKS